MNGVMLTERHISFIEHLPMKVKSLIHVKMSDMLLRKTMSIQF